MKKLFKNFAAPAALLATSFAAAAPAEARGHRGGEEEAIIGAIVGIGVGVAIGRAQGRDNYDNYDNYDRYIGNNNGRYCQNIPKYRIDNNGRRQPAGTRTVCFNENGRVTGGDGRSLGADLSRTPRREDCVQTLRSGRQIVVPCVRW